MDKKTLKIVGVALLVVMVVIVILQNTASVETKFLFVSFAMPRVVLLSTMLVVGFLLGILFAGRLRREKDGESKK